MKLNPLVKFLLVIATVILIELLAFNTINAFSKTLKPINRNILLYTYWTLTIGFFVFMICFPMLRNWNGNREVRAVVSVLFMALLVGKLVIASISLIDIIKRGIATIIAFCYAKNNVPAAITQGMSRSMFLNKVALIGGGAMAGVLFWGVTNRYNYKLRNVKVPFTNLPDCLKHLKIVQISDVHSGSFTSTQAVQKGIDMIMAQQPDIIFFTGDLVNNIATEMHDYISIFAQLKAPYGVYSTLGNHDYGDYYQWENAAAKHQNLEDLKAIHKQMGWDLLLNENRILNIKGEQLAIIGVENISGSNRFHSYGDLSKAMKGAENTTHKILLSHDPSHWDAEVNQSNYNIQLTLSGHTHGMQFGLELPFLKWSPVKYAYKQWAGIYKNNDNYLNVNRGFGFLGYPGRVGILPEITVIALV
jgi:uncharacterized protein